MGRRTLVLVRHAKSDYPPSVEDHDRPLSERGERDAEAAAAALRGQEPELVLCSTAARARRTWDLIETGLGHPVTVRYERALYNASSRAILGLVRGIDEGVQRLAVVAHNPGTQELAEQLAGRGKGGELRRMAQKFPTAGIAVLAVDGSWSELDAGGARLVAFHVPRG
jgi:phosphohistidine phosphatase